MSTLKRYTAACANPGAPNSKLRHWVNLTTQGVGTDDMPANIDFVQNALNFELLPHCTADTTANIDFLQFKTQPFYLQITFWRNLLSNIPVSVFPFTSCLKFCWQWSVISISTNDESFQVVCVSSSFSLFLILRNIITWISCLTTCHVVNIILFDHNHQLLGTRKPWLRKERWRSRGWRRVWWKTKWTSSWTPDSSQRW